MVEYALITGANGGIGRSLCASFRAAGYSVIATDTARHSDTACHHYIELDLASLVRQESARKTFSSTLTSILAEKHLSTLINNAATQRLGATEEISPSDFITTLDINVTAPFLLTQICLPFLERATGSIINIGSIHSQLTKPRFPAYATSKAALAGLTRALAIDLGDRVRVNAISPAAIATAMLLEGFSGNDTGYQALETHHPAKRIGQPSEVSELALFLASNKLAGFINGASIDLSGGIHARLHDPE